MARETTHKFRRERDGEYIALDNSSIIYPPTEAKYNSNVFRISAELKENVKPDILLKALEDILQRIPYFRSRLCEGFFWFYLTRNKKQVRIYQDGPRPCMRILNRKDMNGFLFRVSYYQKRIAVDFFHALTDGGGGKIFFLSLLARYFELQGHRINDNPQIISCKSKPEKWETRDWFQHLYRKVPYPNRIRRSYRYSGQLADRTYFISGEIDLQALKIISQRLNATINELFAAMLIQIFLKKEAKLRQVRPVQISVPVGLRPVYNLNTLRNFSLFAVLSVDPRLGPYSLEEIIRTIHLQMQTQLDTKELDRNVSRNVAGERNFLVRIVPNLIKRPFFKILTDVLGDAQYTSTLSNLGNISLPSQMAELINRFDFFLSPNKKNVLMCAAAGFDGKVVVNFNSYLQFDTSVEREFFSQLVEWGIPVKVFSNRSVSNGLLC